MLDLSLGLRPKAQHSGLSSGGLTRLDVYGRPSAAAPSHKRANRGHNKGRPRKDARTGTNPRLLALLGLKQHAEIN